MLAICLMREQGIEVHALNIQTMFGCCKDDARQAAHDLGVDFAVLKVGDDYLNLVRSPKYGHGRGINPCVDCRIYMFDLAKKYMAQTGASFLVTGEVLNQRPMSQKMSDFVTIEADSGLEGLIVRPLSAKRLPVTRPEKEGMLDRAKMLGLQGRSRVRLIAIAKRYGIMNPPAPSSGCSLVAPEFAQKVRDIFEHADDYQRWEFEILKMGRHFRLSPRSRVILGRNEEQNQYFEYLHPEGTVLMTPQNFEGPAALVVGPEARENLKEAAALILRFSRKPFPEEARVQAECGAALETVSVTEPTSDEQFEKVRIV